MRDGDDMGVVEAVCLVPIVLVGDESLGSLLLGYIVSPQRATFPSLQCRLANIAVIATCSTASVKCRKQ